MAFTSVEEIFEKMPQVFNPTTAKGVDTIFQFHITGEQGGDWNVIVKDQTCEINEGVHKDPSVSLTMSDVDWIAICNGKLDPMMAFMEGKLMASGDVMAGQLLSSLFPLQTG